jgi:hypothetical protein
MNVKLSLVILGIDLSTGTYHVLSLHTNTLALPFAILNEGTDIDMALRYLKQEYVDLDSDWIYTKIYKCNKTKNDISLFYKATIPLDSTLINAYWIPLTITIAPEEILEALRD